jgi:uncharacterized RDD family membrane protein YckC
MSDQHGGEGDANRGQQVPGAGPEPGPPPGHAAPQPGQGPGPGFGPGYAPGYAPTPGQAPGYGPAAGQAPGYAPGYGPPVAALPPLASWGRRGVAAIVDLLLFFACMIPAGVMAAVAGTIDETVGLPDALSAVLFVAFVVLLIAGGVVSLVNQSWQQGKRGQSWGKRMMGIRLVRERDLQPPGGGVGVARYAVRVALGNATCGLYSVVTLLAPLWDERNRTIDDMIVQTLVIHPPPP